MANVIPVLPKGGQTSSDLSAFASIGKCVKLSSGKYILATVAGERTQGILVVGSSDTAAGDGNYGGVTVESKGLAEGLLGGTVSAKDYLTTDASGTLVRVSAGGQHVRAIAQVDGVSGDLIEVELVDFILPVVMLTVFVNFVDLDNKTVFTHTPAFTGKIQKTNLAVMHACTDATGKTAVINPKIAGTAVTGGIISLDTTASGANNVGVGGDGANVAGTAVTALNSFGPTDAITLVCDNTTNLTDGSGNIIITMFPTGT